MNLMLGSEEVQKFRAAMADLEGLEPLMKFVLAYANVNQGGDRLTTNNTILEAILFAVWLEACAKLEVRPSDPNVTVQGVPL